MTKHQMTDLHKLSVKDKIKVVQTLWDDIAKEQSIETLSLEHKKILDERIQKINSGNAQFKSWSEVQNKYQKLL
ncbi:MAG: addiction module protein [Bacteroidales bacterium]|nr:addiction module protein [Bacteroidales bacterium]MDP3002768.1 addiction module protein [Bacteroidales bacterium]